MTGPRMSDVELRLRLRPAAWTVWTAVVAHATPNDEGVVFAAVSVRALADELGLAKDTVAGCLQRLARLELIERRPQGHVAGRFVAGGYLVHHPEPPNPDVSSRSSSVSTSPPRTVTPTATDRPNRPPHPVSPSTSSSSARSTPPPTDAPSTPRPTIPAAATAAQLSLLGDV